MKMICTACKATFEGAQLRCVSCSGPLDVMPLTEGTIRRGDKPGASILERYLDFLPLDRVNTALALGEGNTPLLPSGKLAEVSGIGKLFFKNEAQNPTWSFKDRGTAVGVQYAAAHGYKRIGAVSTGNMAASVAAYGARAGMDTFIFVSDRIDVEKVSPIAIYGPHLFKVAGDYSQLYFETLKIGAENDIFFINSDVPLRVEGSKTIAFEICEQLSFDAPDYVVVPTSAGGNFRGIAKGFMEFHKLGFINKMPHMVCAQAAGCSPIHNAFSQGKSVVERVEHPDTIAHAINNPFPPSGNAVLSILGEYNGVSVSVTDEEMIRAQKMLAEEGLFVQPDSAVTLAATIKLGQDGLMEKDASVVCVLTGSGLKFTKALELHDIKSHNVGIGEVGKYISKQFG